MKNGTKGDQDLDKIHVQVDSKEELAREQLKRLFALQEQRVHALGEFDIKFREYLLDAPEFDINKLKLMCKETSDEMNEISSAVLAIRQMFSSECFNSPLVYSLIDRLQTYEQTKFKLTLDSYMCEQDRLEKLATTDEYELELNFKLSNLRKEINETKQLINDCLEELRYELSED